MNILRTGPGWVRKLLFSALFCSLAGFFAAAAAAEETFAVLEIGTHTYKNVTVTTKAKDYIFILHSGGMSNIKLADLSPELREQLGYKLPEKRGLGTNSVAGWAKQKVANLDLQQLEKVQQRLGEQLSHSPVPVLPAAIKLNPTKLNLNTIALAAGVILLLHLGFSYCAYLICRKTGHKPGALVWLPVLQILPMLQAAGMSRLWFLAGFVPILNLIGGIVWCFRIASARDKTAFVGFLLLLPVTSLLTFLYLAFSDRPPKKIQPGPRIRIMTLETA